MDERSLELSIETYKSQLVQVETALLASGTENSQDLVQLKNDLLELIQLTESSLLSLKKSNLLRELDNVSAPGASSSMDQEFAAFQAAIAEESSVVSDNSTCDNHPGTSSVTGDLHSLEGETSDDYLSHSEQVAGMKCRAPHSHDWGHMKYHNALVLSLQPITKESLIPKLRVVFCYPTHQSMVVCPYFLEGKCRYEEDKCRFSHGYIVNMSDIKDFQEPDYSRLTEGCKCLARYHDNVWYTARVTRVLDDHKYEVQYDMYNETSTVELEDVVPSEVDDDNGGDSSDEDYTDSTKLKALNDESSDDDLPVFLWKPPQTTEKLGEWEAHTRGIGSKLMSKMGYITGQGLGKAGDGRAEPVPILLLPPGKSLDKVMELKEQAGDQCLMDVLKKQKMKAKQQSQQVAQGYKDKGDKLNVFDFINKKLHGKRADLHSLVRSHDQGKKRKDVRQITEADLKQKSDKQVNIQLLKTHEEIRNIDKQLARLQESLRRNEDRDPLVAKRTKQKIESLEKYRLQLTQSEKSMTKHKTMRSEHKKLTIF